MKKIVCFLIFIFSSLKILLAAPNLTVEMSMDVRDKTAVAAKKDATESAIRGGLIQVLSRYSDRALIENMLMGENFETLQNLVASTSISNEKSSKTAYSAKFSITVDRVALEKWYSDKNIPNFLSAADESKDRSIVSIDLINGLSDWVQLNQIIHSDGDEYGLSLRSIYGTSITAYILTVKIGKFRDLCRNNGWTVSSQDGITRISRPIVSNL